MAQGDESRRRRRRSRAVPLAKTCEWDEGCTAKATLVVIDIDEEIVGSFCGWHATLTQEALDVI